MRGPRADQALRRPRRARLGELQPRHAASSSASSGANGAGKTTLLSVTGRRARAGRGVALGRRARSAGCHRRWRSTRGSRSPRTCGCSRAWRRSPTSRRSSSGCSNRRGLADRRRRAGRPAVGRQPPAPEHRARAARRPCGAAARRADGRAGPRPARAALGVHRRAGGAATTVLFSSHELSEVGRRAGRVLALEDGRLSERIDRSAVADPQGPRDAAALAVARRPARVYPIVIALMIGAAFAGMSISLRLIPRIAPLR